MSDIDTRKILKMKTRDKIKAALDKERITYHEGRTTISFNGKTCTFDGAGKLLMVNDR